MSAPADASALVRHLEIRSRRALTGPFAGDYRSRIPGHGLEFAALRPYEAGDDPRAIDPAASARTGALQVRLRREERARTLFLLADVSPSVTSAKRRLLEEAVALVAFAAAHYRDRVGLAAFSDRIAALVPPGAGWRHARSLVTTLLGCGEPGRATDLAPPLEVAGRVLRQRSLVLVLSDFHAPLPAPPLRRLATRHETAALVLRDRREAAPGEAGLFLLAEAETGRRQTVDLTTAAARRRWTEAWQRHDRELATELARLGVQHAVAATGEGALAPLRRLFRPPERGA